ncbi:CPBP family intramembrane glutamic endopeptidase [Pseudomonas sp. CAU 1711]|uniref:CPBP family intramembrane glutamic endopeptidase n=1 Tax=Pseudomonas sp. CAU 1711 TaxID=3140356 RepID=UPI003261C4D7
MPPLHLRLLPPSLTLALGLALGFIAPPAAAFCVLYMGWVLLAERRLPFWLWWCGGLAGGIALAAHLLPGFQPLALWSPRLLSPDAPPYGLRLSWDKLLLGLTLLAWWLGRPPVAQRKAWAAWPVAAATLLLVPPPALALGVVDWQPKWPQGWWLWLVVNLSVAVLAEELLFRAWLQSALTARLGAVAGIGLTALLFGAAHAPFSPAFALVAGCAGLGYGLVFHLGARLWPAVALHGAVNTLHFLLLSYPLRAS